MNNIYVAHANSSDFRDVLYPAVETSHFGTNEHVVYPHKHPNKQFHSKDYIKTCSLFLADGSEPSTGMGIELAWADMYHVPILCVHREEKKPSSSISYFTKEFISYKNKEDLRNKLDDYYQTWKQKG